MQLSSVLAALSLCSILSASCGGSDSAEGQGSGLGSGGEGQMTEVGGSGFGGGAPHGSQSTTTGSAQASCSDGVQNGSEQDVDCGGSCAPCCDPKTYDATSGLVSGTATVCCEDGDKLVAVIDCGEGMNHGAHPEGDDCGLGYEGAMNGGSACVKISCSGGCSTSTTSSSSAGSTSSSGSGGGSCAHDKCTTGAALDAGCDACVGDICAMDDFCCDTSGDGEWDEFCVGYVAEVCSLAC